MITGLLALCVGGYYLSWNRWAPLAPGVYPGRMFYYMGGTTTIYPAVRTAIQNIFAY
jgi:hypothetical protein